MSDAADAPARYELKRRLGVGLAVLVALVLGGALLLVTVVRRYHATLDTVAREAVLASRARALGVSAREQYIHEAHTIILGDRSHLGHHDAWVDHFRRSARALAATLPPEDRVHLAAIEAQSAALNATFARDILPAIDRRDVAAVRAAHGRVEALVEGMILHADALGGCIEQRARAHAVRAEVDARLAVGVGVALAALAVAVALTVVRGVWGGVAVPLARLQRVAERVAGGDTEARVGPLAARELDAVGAAFDQMLDRLARREAALVQAERLAVVGRIAAGVAHEINNPIGVIRGYLKTMRADARDPDLAAELAILDEEALACQRIAEDLLTYARSPAVDRRPTRLDALVRDAVARLESTGELGRCDLDVELEPATLDVDPLRVRQVVTNLLRNGAQATDGDGVLEVRGQLRPAGYELTVADRGPGIAPEVRRSLFEPFATARAGGTGLGLAVCQGIVLAHGGEIRAADRPGGGTVFTVRLPTERAGDAPVEAVV